MPKEGEKGHKKVKRINDIEGKGNDRIRAKRKRRGERFTNEKNGRWISVYKNSGPIKS